MTATRSGLLRAVVAALVLALVTYLASTALLDAWVRSREVPTAGQARFPEVVYDAPESVATTRRRGPVGPVAAVFAATRVLDGLGGHLVHPWIAVSSRTGDYRAVSGPNLPAATAGGVRVSPAGERLLVLTGELRVLEVTTGEVVATLGEVPAGAVTGAVWRPDGTAVSLVDGGLVEIDVASGRRTSSAGSVPGDAQLAWSPSGAKLVTLQQMSGARRLQVWRRLEGGGVSLVGVVPAEGIAPASLLGFSGGATVAVAGRALETGATLRVLEVRVDGSGTPVDLGTLPGSGTNWVGVHTLGVAAGALLAGTADFEEPRWPWSHRAKLVAAVVLALFGLGMHLTRRPRRRPARIK